jgi:cytochrome c peroxidase
MRRFGSLALALPLPAALLGVIVATSPAAEAHPDAAVVAITPEELGRLLFWDPVLSGPMDVACATCHHPDFAYADGRDLALGTGSVGIGPTRTQAPGSPIPVVPRNAPTVLNVAMNGLDDRRGEGPQGRRDEFGQIAAAMVELRPDRAPMFWDSRVRSLEAQALEPLKVREEMRGDAFPEEVAVDSVVARLRAIPEYVALFQEAFPQESPVTADQVARSIAAFQRTLVAVDSRFDRYQAGDLTALTAQELRGLEEFDDARCTQCHDGPMLSDFDVHAEGVAENPLLTAPDEGARRFRFRTPSLRNVALTAPYMHNGMLATLEDVLAFYDRGQSENPNVANRRNRDDDDDDDAVVEAAPRLAVLDNDFRRVDNMSESEMADIIAFLGSLSDPNFDRTIPSSVPSGLPPGGAIGSAN